MRSKTGKSSTSSHHPKPTKTLRRAKAGKAMRSLVEQKAADSRARTVDVYPDWRQSAEHFWSLLLSLRLEEMAESIRTALRRSAPIDGVDQPVTIRIESIRAIRNALPVIHNRSYPHLNDTQALSLKSSASDLDECLREASKRLGSVADRIDRAERSVAAILEKHPGALDGIRAANGEVVSVESSSDRPGVAIHRPDEMRDGDLTDNAIFIDGRLYSLTNKIRKFVSLAIKAPAPMAVGEICRAMGWKRSRQSVDNYVSKSNERLKYEMQYAGALRILQICMRNGLQCRWPEKRVYSKSG